MTAEVRGVLVTVVGMVATRLAVTGDYQAYVKVGMRWPLLVSGVALLALGATTLVRAWRSPAPVGSGPHDEHEHHDHEHHAHEGHGRVGWLLGLPVVALLLVAPAPLGADAVRRESRTATLVTVVDEIGFTPLPAPRDGAVDLSLLDFVTRAYYDAEESLANVPVRLVGFAVNDPSAPGGYLLTRFEIACCAADALPVSVVVSGVGEAVPDDTWLEVVGTWVPPDDPSLLGVDRGARIELVSQTVITEPSNPYG